MVVNACLDEQRRRKRFLSFDFFKSGDGLSDGMSLMDQQQAKQFEQKLQAMAQEDHHAQLEISAAVKAAVKELKPKLRMAILLKYFEGLNNEEVAAALDKPVGAIKSLQHRALDSMRRVLAAGQIGELI